MNSRWMSPYLLAENENSYVHTISALVQWNSDEKPRRNRVEDDQDSFVLFCFFFCYMLLPRLIALPLFLSFVSHARPLAGRLIKLHNWFRFILSLSFSVNCWLHDLFVCFWLWGAIWVFHMSSVCFSSWVYHGTAPNLTFMSASHSMYRTLPDIFILIWLLGCQISRGTQQKEIQYMT